MNGGIMVENRKRQIRSLLAVCVLLGLLISPATAQTSPPRALYACGETAMPDLPDAPVTVTFELPRGSILCEDRGTLIGDTTVEVALGDALTMAQVPIPIGLAGHYFAYWIARPDSRDLSLYFDLWDLPDLMITEATTITAVFRIPAGRDSYDVVFLRNDGRIGLDNVIDLRAVAPDETISAPAPPTRAGFAFAGWTTDAAGDTPFDFHASRFRDSALFLYAQWEPDAAQAIGFDDVAEDSWYHPYVQFAAARQIMQGTGDRTFSPHTGLSRAMLATILWRLEDEPAATFQPVFSDVPSSAPAWYRDAVIWASENGIVQGFDGRFEPYGEVTREQFAAMLYRYAAFTGGCTTVPDSFHLNNFQDRGQISDWAAVYMYWAVYNALIQGLDEQTLVPGGTATRAQSAAILMRFVSRFA